MGTATIGRPSIYSEDLANEICRRLADGESTRQICRDDHMPAMSQIYIWQRDRADFQKRYAEAREIWLEHLAHEILDIGDDSQNDWMDRETRSGRIQRQPDRELTQRSQIRIEARKWLLSKLRPDKYGDRNLGAPQELVVTVRPSWEAVSAVPVKRLPQT